MSVYYSDYKFYELACLYPQEYLRVISNDRGYVLNTAYVSGDIIGNICVLTPFHHSSRPDLSQVATSLNRQFLFKKESLFRITEPELFRTIKFPASFLSLYKNKSNPRIEPRIEDIDDFFKAVPKSLYNTFSEEDDCVLLCINGVDNFTVVKRSKKTITVTGLRDRVIAALQSHDGGDNRNPFLSDYYGVDTRGFVESFAQKEEAVFFPVLYGGRISISSNVYFPTLSRLFTFNLHNYEKHDCDMLERFAQ